MIPVKVLAVRYLSGTVPALAKALGAPEGMPCLAMLTTDCDDATYIALDAATKAAQVRVCYGRSFYAGAANASTPNAGEVIGILAGHGHNQCPLVCIIILRCTRTRIIKKQSVD